MKFDDGKAPPVPSEKESGVLAQEDDAVDNPQERIDALRAETEEDWSLGEAAELSCFISHFEEGGCESCQ